METGEIMEHVTYYEDSAYLVLSDIEDELADDFTFDDAIEAAGIELEDYYFVEVENYATNNRLTQRAIWHEDES